MANHLRRQVREAFVTLLTGLSTTGARVYVNNDDPLDASLSNALKIRVGPESVEQTGFNGDYVEFRRTMTFTVSAMARSTTATAVLNALDGIVQEVEVATLRRNAEFLSGLTVGMTLVSTDTLTSGEANDYVGQVDMQYEIRVSARQGYPDTLA